MRYGTIAVAGLLAAMSVTQAQTEYQTKIRLEVRPFAGMFVPTGTQSLDFKTASTFGFAAALELNENVHFLASAGVTNGHSKLGALLTSDQSTMWQYDIGAEFNALNELGAHYLWKPFVGVGAGMRSFSFKEPGMSSSSCESGYASIGSELQRNAVALRLEGRSYVSCFKNPLNTETTFRGDFSFMFGFAYHIT